MESARELRKLVDKFRLFAEKLPASDTTATTLRKNANELVAVRRSLLKGDRLDAREKLRALPLDLIRLVKTEAPNAFSEIFTPNSRDSR